MLNARTDTNTINIESNNTDTTYVIDMDSIGTIYILPLIVFLLPLAQ